MGGLGSWMAGTETGDAQVGERLPKSSLREFILVESLVYFSSLHILASRVYLSQLK